MTQIVRNGIRFSRLNANDKEESTSPFMELIKCKICFNILLNPYDCNNCGNSFCFECINNFITGNLPCPFKCTQYSIKPSSFGITSYLSKLEFTCLNKQNGCNEIIPYSSVIDHEKECKYFYTTCPNVQCGKTMQWTLIENHLRNECEYTLFKCPLCHLDFGRNEHSDHVSNCQSVNSTLQYTINTKQPNSKPNTNTQGNTKGNDSHMDINDLINSLPELKDMSLVSFIKILLYQINQSNKGLNEKFDSMHNEMMIMKEESEKACRNNMVFFENINTEIESLNTKLEFIEMNDNIKQCINDNIQNAVMIHNSNKPVLTEMNQSSISNVLRISNRKTPMGAEIKKDKEIHQMKKDKRVKEVKLPKRVNGYSPRDCPSNNISTSTPNQSKSDNNNSLIGDSNSNKFNQPIARPFNTFSNFSNSNLITIINNQEIILNKLNVLSKKVDEIAINDTNLNSNNKNTKTIIAKQLSFPEPEAIIHNDNKLDSKDMLIQDIPLTLSKEDEIIEISQSSDNEKDYENDKEINNNDENANDIKKANEGQYDSSKHLLNDDTNQLANN